MTSLDDRIAQFENMTAADPQNDMAHFSLGNAYLQAGRHGEAAERFERCLEINPEMSKAYQLAGDAMIKAGWTDKAVATLERGYEVAASKGDLMPKNAMAELLESIGRTPPELSDATKERAEEIAASGSFICQRTGRPGHQLDAPPFKGAIGAWIQEHISQETWRDWIGQGTKVINELRLDLSREEDAETYDEHMYEFIGLDAETRATLTSNA